MNALTLIGGWFCFVIGLLFLAGATYFVAYLNWIALRIVFFKISDWRTFSEFVEWKREQDGKSKQAEDEAKG